MHRCYRFGANSYGVGAQRVPHRLTNLLPALLQVLLTRHYDRHEHIPLLHISCRDNSSHTAMFTPTLSPARLPPVKVCKELYVIGLSPLSALSEAAERLTPDCPLPHYNLIWLLPTPSGLRLSVSMSLILFIWDMSSVLLPTSRAVNGLCHLDATTSMNLAAPSPQFCGSTSCLRAEETPDTSEVRRKHVQP